MAQNEPMLSNQEIVNELAREFQNSLDFNNPTDDFVISPGSSGPEEELSSPEEESSSILVQEEMESPRDDESDTDSEEGPGLDREKFQTSEELLLCKESAEASKKLGNLAFLSTQYVESIDHYSDGLKICPYSYTSLRAMLYCNRATAKFRRDAFESAIKDCNKAIACNNHYIKAYIRRAQCYEKTDRFEEALQDIQLVLEKEPENRAAQEAADRLPGLIDAKTEKLKEDMLLKLKDLGNLILKPFGLSTENFQLEQDPDTKGYKVNFKQ